MRNVFNLPSSLLLLLTTSSLSTASNYAVDKRMSRAKVEGPSPHAEILEKRDNAIKRRMMGEAPFAVRKMSDNPEEKFYPEYWQFEVGLPLYEENLDISNVSAAAQPSAPFLPHSDELLTSFSRMRSFPRNLFEKRAYHCPTGTTSCSAIGYPNSCCSSGQTCMIIADTGLGNVGCCPSGQTCAGSVSSCNTALGYTSCPDSSNGGCCIPGYACDSVGCIAGGTTVITESFSTTSMLPTTTLIATTTVITSYDNVVTTATVVFTEVITITTSSSIAILTVYVTTTTPTSTAYIGISTAQVTVYTTITQAVPPERPTSDSSSSISTSTGTTTITTVGALTTTTTTAGYCPTGFYQCSAYYDGGCCRVGANCDTSSCPSSGSTAVVIGSVVTIVVGTGYGVTTVTTGNSPEASTVVSTISPSLATTTTTITTVTPSTTVVSASVSPDTTVVDTGGGTATCAVGWYGCAAGDGGGCCPSGYSCAASCIATQSGEPDHVYKVPANHAASVSVDGMGKWFFVAACLTGLGMVLL